MGQGSNSCKGLWRTGSGDRVGWSELPICRGSKVPLVGAGGGGKPCGFLAVVALVPQERPLSVPLPPRNRKDPERQVWVWEVIVCHLRGTAFPGVGLGLQRLPFSYLNPILCLNVVSGNVR